MHADDCPIQRVLLRTRIWLQTRERCDAAALVDAVREAERHPAWRDAYRRSALLMSARHLANLLERGLRHDTDPTPDELAEFEEVRARIDEVIAVERGEVH